MGLGAVAEVEAVITNHHVIDGCDWATIQVEFDYRADSDGRLIPSRLYNVSAPPIISSPSHPIDLGTPETSGTTT
jgi:hypothetical protein